MLRRQLFYDKGKISNCHFIHIIDQQLIWLFKLYILKITQLKYTLVCKHTFSNAAKLLQPSACQLYPPPSSDQSCLYASSQKGQIKCRSVHLVYDSLQGPFPAAICIQTSTQQGNSFTWSKEWHSDVNGSATCHPTCFIGFKCSIQHDIWYTIMISWFSISSVTAE